MSQAESQREYWNMLYNSSEFDSTKLDMSEVDFTMIDQTTQPPLDEPGDVLFPEDNNDQSSGGYESGFSTYTYDEPQPPSAVKRALPTGTTISIGLTILGIILIYYIQITKGIQLVMNSPIHVNNLFLWAILFGIIRVIVALFAWIIRSNE